MGGEDVHRCEVGESILNGEEDHGQRHGGEKATCGFTVPSTQGSSGRRGEEEMMEARVYKSLNTGSGIWTFISRQLKAITTLVIIQEKQLTFSEPWLYARPCAKH